MNKPYIIHDMNGNPINSKYPPDKDKYGEEFGGYKNKAEEIIYHQFAVLSKEVCLLYNDNYYDIRKIYDSNSGCWSISTQNYEFRVEERFTNEIELIENCKIDGKRLIDIIDDIEFIKIIKKSVNPYIAYDKNGYPYNSKYPPNKEKYGHQYNGYKNNIEETFFHDFGVQGYDLSFRYKGMDYYALTEADYAAVCNEHFNEEYEVYANAMELLENFRIDGKALIELINDIEAADIFWI